jgi:Zn-dependent M28 family amino/carboxypeptidase
MTKYNYNPHHSDSFIELQGHNVVAFLDNNASKTIVIGAHYDHIGKNEFNLSMISSDKSKTQVHNGADDNASGVAAVLDLARRLSSNKLIEKSNFVFVCFSGEEIGLNGSKEFLTKNKSIMKFDAMINMDMIGRMDSFHNLYIGGVGTSKNFRETIDKLKPLDFSSQENLFKFILLINYIYI